MDSVVTVPQSHFILSSMRYLFVDCETTGLNPRRHEIISICMITYDGGKCIDRWAALIHPQNIEAADPKALEINGYCKAAWSGAWEMEDAIQMIAQKMKQHNMCFVGYHPGFDMSFIRVALEQYGYHLKRLRMIDVMTLVNEHLIPLGLHSMSLDNTRRFLGMPLANNHTALQDTLDTIYIYNLLSRSTIWQRLWWRLKYHLRVYLSSDRL